MTEPQARHVLAITPTARRQLTEHLPEAVAAAAYEFIVGPLLDNPTGSASNSTLHSMIGTAPAVAPSASSTARRSQAHGDRARRRTSPRRLPSMTVGAATPVPPPGSVEARTFAATVVAGEAAHLTAGQVAESLRAAEVSRYAPLFAPLVTQAYVAVRHAAHTDERSLAGSAWRQTGFVFTTEFGEPATRGTPCARSGW